MNAVMLLYVVAFVVFIVALLDHPVVSATRCIALGLALVTLAQIISH